MLQFHLLISSVQRLINPQEFIGPTPYFYTEIGIQPEGVKIILNAPFISLCSLVAAVLISVRSRVNLGVVCVGLAFFVGLFFKEVEISDIYMQGFPLSLFFLLLGTTLFSSIATQNGTYHELSKHIAYLSHGNRKLACLLIFMFSFVFSFLGMGTIVTTVIVLPLLLQMGKEEMVPEILVILLAISGCIAGGLSILAPTGIIGATLGAEVGVTAYWPIYVASFLTFTMHGLLIFFLFGGHKLTRIGERPYEPLVLHGRQFFTVIVAFAVITAILGFKLDIGLSTFFGAAILLLCKAADQDQAIKGISWGVMLLLCGVSMLIYVVKASGGVAAVKMFVENNMAAGTAGGLTAMLAGAMSFVSSSSVIVMPTIIPMVSGFVGAANGEVSPLFLTAAVIIGTHTVPYSPASTLGAIGMALSSEKDENKLFLKLVLTAAIMYFSTVLLFFAGAYNILNKF